MPKVAEDSKVLGTVGMKTDSKNAAEGFHDSG